MQESFNNIGKLFLNKKCFWFEKKTLYKRDGSFVAHEKITMNSFTSVSSGIVLLLGSIVF